MHMRSGRGSTEAKQGWRKKITKDIITSNRDNKGKEKV
jgi:hypothetical protein